jgi:hypothetical protein
LGQSDATLGLRKGTIKRYLSEATTRLPARLAGAGNRYRGTTVGLTEQELRDHLADAAAQASEPRFALVHIADRVRQRRRRLTFVASSGLAIILAVAVVVPLTLGNGQPHAGGGVPSAPAPPPREHFAVTVNGERSHLPGTAFAVRPGEKLTIEIDVSVPKNNTITSLWLGISTGDYGFTGTHGTYGNAGLTPIGIRPLLLRVRRPLTAGLHTTHYPVDGIRTSRSARNTSGRILDFHGEGASLRRERRRSHSTVRNVEAVARDRVPVAAAPTPTPRQK